MKKSTTDAAAFLRNMQTEPQVSAPARPTSAKTASRSGLKHVGGYLDSETVEKFAILRARLGLDNSELMVRAIDELYARQNAKRAFGDQ